MTADPDQSKEASADEAARKCGHAFYWIRVFSRDDKYSHIEAEIESENLADLLRVNLTHHIEFAHHDSIVRLLSPFKALIHNWTKLISETHLREDDTVDQTTARVDLKRLMDQNRLL